MINYLITFILLFSFIVPTTQAQEQEEINSHTLYCYGMIIMWCQKEIQTRLCMRLEKDNCDLGVYDGVIQIIHLERLDK